MTGNISRLLFVLSALLLLMPATAQTINFTADVDAPDGPETRNYQRTLVGHADNVGTLGNALLTLRRNQPLADDYETPVGDVAGNLIIAFNRLDQITIGTAINPDPDAESVELVGKVLSGIGEYAGATSPNGATKLTLTRTSTSPLRHNLSLTGAATVGGNQLDLTISNAQIEQTTTMIQVFDNFGGNGTSAELGDLTVAGTSRPDTNNWETAHFLEVVVTCTFSPADSLQLFLKIVDDPPPPDTPVTIVGGTGKYAGASGTAAINFPDQDRVTLTGSVTLAGPTTPIITQVNTASGLNSIGQNTWIEIKGINLVPPDTPPGGRFWSNAPEFLEGKMPTELDGVGVTTNGNPAFVWWYCSAATTPGCATDQINVLTALDDYVGRVPIVVNNGTESSGVFVRFLDVVNPTFLLFSAAGDVVATHADGSLVGPTSLFPGMSTPGLQGETISLWGAGFGLPTTPLVPGSSTQTGSLPDPLNCFLNGDAVQTTAALVSPGLYQVNLTISGNAMVSDHDHLWCTYHNKFTPDVLLAVH